jgi:preprotein translocase subunit YajC
MTNLFFILMAQPQGDANPITAFLPLVLVLVIFWFFMIRPQAKKQKELRKFRDSLQKGDKVVTTGGIYGKVVTIKDYQIVLQVDENTNLTVDKSSVLKDSTDLQQVQR